MLSIISFFLLAHAKVGAQVNYTMYNPLHTTQVNKVGRILVKE
jgi:hypothetical protein